MYLARAPKFRAKSRSTQMSLILSANKSSSMTLKAGQQRPIECKTSDLGKFTLCPNYP